MTTRRGAGEGDGAHNPAPSPRQTEGGRPGQAAAEQLPIVRIRRNPDQPRCRDLQNSFPVGTQAQRRSAGPSIPFPPQSSSPMPKGRVADRDKPGWLRVASPIANPLAAGPPHPGPPDSRQSRGRRSPGQIRARLVAHRPAQTPVGAAVPEHLERQFRGRTDSRNTIGSIAHSSHHTSRPRAGIMTTSLRRRGIAPTRPHGPDGVVLQPMSHSLCSPAPNPVGKPTKFTVNDTIRPRPTRRNPRFNRDFCSG